MKKILIADDETMIVELLTTALESEDVEIIGVHNGKEALDYVGNHRVDLVISDVMMPEIQGIDLFFKLKEIDPFIQIVVITGYPSLKDIVKMFEAGACDFLIKPFDIKQVRTIVAECFSRLDRWRRLRKEWAMKKLFNNNLELF